MGGWKSQASLAIHLVSISTWLFSSSAISAAMRWTSELGELLATATFNAPAGLHDAPLAIASESFSFYVGGFANFPSEDFLSLRYDLPDLL